MERKDGQQPRRTRARARRAGNAQFDPTNQTQREDMAPDEQKSGGPPARGTAPSHEADRSQQPYREDREDPLESE